MNNCYVGQYELLFLLGIRVHNELGTLSVEYMRSKVRRGGGCGCVSTKYLQLDLININRTTCEHNEFNTTTNRQSAAMYETVELALTVYETI